MKKIIFLISIIFAIILSGCSDEKTEIKIYSSVVLTDSLNEIIKNFEKSNKEVSINVRYDNSIMLKDEIIDGASPDIFFASSSAEIKELENARLVDENSSTSVISNKMVLIVPKNSSIRTTLDLASSNVTKIAVGDPDKLSVGYYTQRVLKYHDLYNILSHKLVYEDSIEEIIDKVANNEVDAGIIYMTYSLNHDDILVVAQAPNEASVDIDYPGVVLSSSKNDKLSHEFLEYISTEESINIFKKYGFIVSPY